MQKWALDSTGDVLVLWCLLNFWLLHFDLFEEIKEILGYRWKKKHTKKTCMTSKVFSGKEWLDLSNFPEMKKALLYDEF